MIFKDMEEALLWFFYHSFPSAGASPSGGKKGKQKKIGQGNGF